jgi:hypothetical protein
LGIVPSAAEGADWSLVGQFSASFTAPKSSLLSVAAILPAFTF